jgi:hypothetical protein
LAIVRFTTIKLIADIASQRPVHPSVTQFIESNVVSQLASILSDEPVIVEQALRILASVAVDSLRPVAKPNVLSLVIQNVAGSPGALDVVVRIIEANMVTVDVLMAAKIVPAIVAAIERKEAQQDAMLLLAATLGLVERQLGDLKSVGQRRQLVKSVQAIATLASKVASLLLEVPPAPGCLCMMVQIFQPIGQQSEVVIDAALHPLSIAISAGCRKPEHTANLAQVVKALQWAAENSSAMRLRLKASGTLLAALKKAFDYGADELKVAANACQKAIRR